MSCPEHLVAHVDRRAGGKRCSQLLLQPGQFVIQTVIFQIAHDLPVFLLVRTPGTVQKLCKFLHPLSFLIHNIPLLFRFIFDSAGRFSHGFAPLRSAAVKKPCPTLLPAVLFHVSRSGTLEESRIRSYSSSSSPSLTLRYSPSFRFPNSMFTILVRTRSFT